LKSPSLKTPKKTPFEGHPASATVCGCVWFALMCVRVCVYRSVRVCEDTISQGSAIAWGIQTNRRHMGHMGYMPPGQPKKADWNGFRNPKSAKIPPFWPCWRQKTRNPGSSLWHVRARLPEPRNRVVNHYELHKCLQNVSMFSIIGRRIPINISISPWQRFMNFDRPRGSLDFKDITLYFRKLYNKNA